MQDTKPRRKSAQLTPKEQSALAKFVGKYLTVGEAAYEIGIHRNVLDRLMLKHQASPETIERVRQAIQS